MKGKAEVLEPLEQGNKGSPLTLGERRMQPNLLRCKVRWQQVRGASSQKWDEGTFPVVPAHQGHTHAHWHTQLRHQTQGSEDQDGRAGKGSKELLVSQCACRP